MSTEEPAWYDTAVSGLGAVVYAVLLLGPSNVPLPGTSSVSVAFSPPASCDVCHGIFDREGSAFGTWAGSAMGHAARDPIFRAALVVAERDAPGVGDFCLRCHAPEAWLSGRCFPTDGSGLLEDDAGVACAFCHRSEPNPWVRNGQYIVAEDTMMRGPYADPVNPDHPTQQSAWVSDARMCGTCHDLYNPLVSRKDLEGRDTGRPFPEQTTYSEWRQSAFATEGMTCQRCHMPEAPGVVARERPERPDRSSHELAGGNVYLLSLIEVLYPELALSAELSRGVARNLASLRTAASLELDVPIVARCGEATRVGIRVVNETGHKLPTGYPEGRRVVLGARAPSLDLERGQLDPETGEPIDALAIYEVRQGLMDTGPGHHLAINDVVFFDNRIPPRGFVPTATTAPVGASYPEVSAGVLAHYHDVDWSFEVPCEHAGTTVEFEVSLSYQSMTKRTLDVLVTDTEDHPAGEWLGAGVALVPPRNYEIARVPFSLSIEAPISIDGGVTADAGPDAGQEGPRDAAANDATSIGPEPSNADEGGCACGSAETESPSTALMFLTLTAFILIRSRKRR